MPSPPDPLAGLRGLHVPEPPGHLAGGLWLAIAVGLAAAVLLELVQRGWVGRTSLRNQALVALATTRGLSGPARLAGQAALLRELAVRLAGPGALRERGDVWLTRLDLMFATDFFSRGPGRAFGDALYRPGEAGDAEQLDRGLAALFARLR